MLGSVKLDSFNSSSVFHSSAFQNESFLFWYMRELSTVRAESGLRDYFTGEEAEWVLMTHPRSHNC